MFLIFCVLGNGPILLNSSERGAVKEDSTWLQSRVIMATPTLQIEKHVFS